ncbi:hypothetical protein RBB50_004066 [Rhinocladiella similis]
MPPSRPAPDLSPSVRRNLFSGHISRRPASGEMDHHHHHHQQPQQQQPHQQRQPQVQSRRLHQRSVSTPSLSPSPARSSPFNANINDSPPTNNALFSHSLLPSPPPHAPFQDTYDPTISPNRPVSPRSSASIFPNSSIVALNPLTGRPALPHIPVLPGHLRLTDSDDDDDDDEKAAQIEDPSSHRQHHHQSQNLGQSEGAYAAAHSQHDGADYAHIDEDYEERAAFERDLRDRLARHRARLQRRAAHGAVSVAANNQHVHTHPSRLSSRRAHRTTKLVSQHDGSPDIEVSSGGYHEQDEHAAPQPYAARDRDRDEEEEDQAVEKGALLSLLMTKLREEVARAEDEAWVFGDTGLFRTGIDDTGYE